MSTAETTLEDVGTLNPLYNTTYTLYRLSPLFHGAEQLLNNTVLATHARRLRDQIRGEVLRGVRVEDLGFGDEGLSSAGKLLEVRWTLLAADISPWAPDQADEDESQPIRGTFIELEYERTKYTAMLLSAPSSVVSTEEGFAPLPLVLARMPSPLRTRLLDYLHTTFDTHSSLLTPSSTFMAMVLEQYLSHTERLKMRDIVLNFSLPSPAAPQLKNMTVTVPTVDIAKFLSRGQNLVSIEPPTPPPEALGKGKRKRPVRNVQSVFKGPFLTAVSYYTTAHMALPVSHPEVQLTRVACAGYVLGVEGKVKIFAPYNARKSRENPSEAAIEEAAIASMEILDALTTYAADPEKTVVEGIEERTVADPDEHDEARRTRTRET